MMLSGGRGPGLTLFGRDLGQLVAVRLRDVEEVHDAERPVGALAIVRSSPVASTLAGRRVVVKVAGKGASQMEVVVLDMAEGISISSP